MTRVVEVRTYDYGNAGVILREKGLLSEIEEALRKVEVVKSGTVPRVLQGFLAEKGWKGINIFTHCIFWYH